MAVNKVEIGGEVKLDLTADTVTPENLLSGATAHNAAGTSTSRPNRCKPLVARGLHSSATAWPALSTIQSNEICPLKQIPRTSRATASRMPGCATGSK